MMEIPPFLDVFKRFSFTFYDFSANKDSEYCHNVHILAFVQPCLLITKIATKKN